MDLIRRVRTGCLALFILALSGLSGCADVSERPEFMRSLREEFKTEEALAKKEALSAEEEEEKEAEKIVLETEMPDEQEDAVSAILESCTKEFIGNHLIDDTFLAWIATEYGGECIVKIAEEVISGRQDANIWHELTGNSIHVLWLLYCKQTGFQQYHLENVIWKPCASSEETTLAFTGDINFSERYVTTRHLDRCENGIYDCFSQDLLEIMNDVDIMMVNNEFTYSTRGKPLAGKAYTFRADPSRVELLDAFGTDIVNLANNHVYDFGSEALLDTISVLKEAKMPYVGAGANIEEASRPCYFICNGRKIAIVAATQIERSTNYTKEATESTPGVLKTLDAEKFVNVIQKAKKNSDIVIAFVHWGTEGDSHYGTDQYELAKEFVEAGADAIIGGHTHCLQGFEIMEEVPIIYSLGNFWFSSGTLDTGLATLTIDERGELSMGFIPCIQKSLKTSLVTDDAERRRILDFMQEHSAEGILVTEDGMVRREN